MVVGALLAVGTTVGAAGDGITRTGRPPSSDEVVAAFTPILEDPTLAETQLGIEVVDLATGEELFALNGDVGFIPASTTKVVTAAAALRTLGPAYQFSTHIYRDGELAPDGVLDGNLYVKGYGDPTLVVERLWKMVHDIQMEGIVEVDGNVIFDDDFFGDDHLIPGWRKKVDLANGPTYFAPLGALSLNFNTACIVIGPGLDTASPA